MKKEVFLAITIGFVLGLVITFGIWTANKSLKQLPKQAAENTGNPTATPIVSVAPIPTGNPAKTGQIPLTISAPDDETLTNTPSVTVTGKSSPNAIITLVYDLGESVIAADSTGSFSTGVSLDGGFNSISVTALDASGNSSTQTLTVTYTTQKI